MERGENNFEKEIEKKGETYIIVEARIMKKMLDMLGISQREFVDKYAKDMSDLIKSNPDIGQRVLDDDPTVDEDIINILLNKEESGNE